MFEGEGNATPAVAAGPVVFVLRVAPHARFQWVGSDLEFRASLPLYQALTGTALQIEMLDKRSVSKCTYSTMVRFGGTRAGKATNTVVYSYQPYLILCALF